MPAYKLTFSCETKQKEIRLLNAERAEEVTLAFKHDKQFPKDVVAILEGQTYLKGYASVSILASFLNNEANTAHIDSYFLDNVLASFSNTTGTDGNSWELTEMVEV